MGDLLKNEGLEYAAERQRHCAVVVVKVDEKVGSGCIVDYCKAHFDVSLAGAFVPLTGKAFRIATMGTMNAPAVFAILGALEPTFRACGVPHSPGGVSAAIEYMSSVAAASGFTVPRCKGY